MVESLSKIDTQWSEMENIAHDNGPSMLAEYLAAKYYDALAAKFKRYAPRLDDLKTYELASDVLYDLIKNDYRGVKRLSRDRGHLRGLFFRIIKSKLFEVGKQKKTSTFEGFEKETNVDEWVNIYIDFNDSVEKLKEQRPKLHLPFSLFYLEGKKIAEIATELGIKENAVKQRLYAARRFLADLLQEYKSK
ncbi:RNA polymerase sigma factor [Candidatus Uabimicrobium amorphum]|uniref:RNA polymerase sigma factor 70 region 4 type 2 domain-containing protein n=1 Tax=Uabimicrobium amorphum TaxID=2596890 RepID=A0A5S9IUN4_UABAM|nr:sigma-70 family RNA polymerase sigma factor [Candidatus Uabimicrobium amorphum]BBM87916.1 hypothetical protein UABAM_06331 [Candidatus Uabimicrobium amorphum]